MREDTRAPGPDERPVERTKQNRLQLHPAPKRKARLLTQAGLSTDFYYY
jgi:hypothetical protein